MQILCDSSVLFLAHNLRIAQPGAIKPTKFLCSVPPRHHRFPNLAIQQLPNTVRQHPSSTHKSRLGPCGTGGDLNQG
ncbi:uncharacterized protein QC763_0032810 [Podospora pseudopauciseta]|uniref:Uncharacterized protein n=1 Tax=Podospora pseudopauciseta TaxID=2093780 RepID=A0ABR0HNE8_9PEZI|nr:hypothetical protein QC763_0032810 [Podospora pseudopauciseta]